MSTNVAELLQHASWMRRLALSLVRDGSTADDLVQETWVAALRHPPRSGEPARPWLGEVLRNVFRARLRSESRRARREEASSDGAVATEELVGAVEQQRLLAEEVLALDEPYRSTILQCFYEGLTAAEVAARHRLPAGTVRWRLKEALDQLRRKLDRKHNGDRAAWLGALMPLTRTKLPTVKGALTMKIALSLLLAGGAAAGVVATMKSRPPAPPKVSAPVAAKKSAEPAKLTRQSRAALLERVQQARKAAPGPTPHQLDADYISDQIREILPLFKECFESALERIPDLNGRVVIHFTIVADPTVGGLVSNSQVVDQKTTIADAQLRECIQENIYAAQFPPPPEGGEMDFEYPFVLKASDDSQ